MLIWAGTIPRFQPGPCTVTDGRHPAWTEEGRFRGALDDVIIIPLVVITLATNNILRFVFSILMRMLDYAFPLAVQIVWLPLFAAKVLGDVILTVINGALRFLPLSEAKRRQWSRSLRRNWLWLRRKIGYRAFEQAVHNAFESGMAWVFRECRHLTPNTALLVIVCAVLWLPISFGVATAMHATLFAKVTSWPAWMQLLSPRNGHREEQAFGATGLPGSLAAGQTTSVRSARIQRLRNHQACVCD
jgi:hypothetical protein